MHAFSTSDRNAVDSVDCGAPTIGPRPKRARTASRLGMRAYGSHHLNLAKIFVVATAAATFYLMVPVVNASGQTNYWAYYWVKDLFWTAFGNCVFMEIMEACLPGAPLIIYSYAYLVGWLTPPILHTVAWALGAADSLVFTTLAQTSSLISITVFYGVWQLEEGLRGQRAGGMLLSEGGEAIIHDAFACTTDVEEYLEEQDDEEADDVAEDSSLPAGSEVDSSHRSKWLRRCKRLALEQSIGSRQSQLPGFSQDADLRGRSDTEVTAASAVDTVNPLLQATPVTKVDALVNNLRGLSVHSRSARTMTTYPRSTQASAAPGISDVESGRDYYSGCASPVSCPALYFLPDLMRRYRLLPRYHYCSAGDLFDAQLTASNRWKQYALAVLFIIGWSAEYIILTIFASKFRYSEPSNRERWFVAFSTAALICKVCMKQLGLILDMGKIGSCSMFFVAEFMCSLFYFTFYRMLFEKFVSWNLFVSVQVTHILFEWFMYCWRASSTYYHVMEQLPDWFVLKQLVVMQGLSLRDWQMFLGLDFVIRIIVFLSTAPAFVCMMVVTMVCPWIKSTLKPMDLQLFCLVMLEIVICVVIEVINSAVMYKAFFQQANLNLLKYATASFKNKRFCVICLGLATCLLINPFAAFEEYTENFTYG